MPSGMCVKLRTVTASNNRDHATRSLYYCLFAPRTCIFVLRAHPVRGESYNQRNTTGEVATTSPPFFTTNRTDRTFFVWRLNSARPPHPGHSTILLRSEIPSGMCAKLRTVAASKNRVRMRWSLYYCLFAPHTYIFVLCTHPVRGESYNQRNTTGEVATLCLIFLYFNSMLPRLPSY